MRHLILTALLATALMPAAARADDPNDPAMRTAAARARDREQIRQLNRQQLAYVQRRDAGYARDWAAWKAARNEGARPDYDRQNYDRSDYARQRAQYERDMANWRRQVAACRAGDYSACGE